VSPVPALAVAVALSIAGLALASLVRTHAVLRAMRRDARSAASRSAAVLDAVRRCGYAAARSSEAVRAELCAAIRRIVPAADCVLIFDEEDGQLACVAAEGSRAAYFAGARIALGGARTLPALALAAGRRVTLEEGGAGGFHPGDAFAVAAPLERERGRASVVYVSAAVPVEGRALEALVGIVAHAGFAYAIARDRENDRRRAEFDALTGLLAPRALRERLAAACEAARFAPLARIVLLFVDTDRFKAWNDAYGHAAGDALLRAIARCLRAAAGGPGDAAGRNGGDEFCLLLAQTEKSAGIERAEALRRAIEELDVSALRPAGAGAGVRVTASIGVAAYPADAATPEALLELADAAMYHSKRSGRNGVSYRGADGLLRRAKAAV
jgi:diguanylate cyclase (GGDEF)-like protein